MNWCNCATSFPECKRCGLKCYPTPDSIQKLKADLTREREAAKVMREALESIAKNKTEDCEIYTMGCDCDQEAHKALAKADEIRGGE